ncbi:erythromycin esterase family protein [Streptomyces sp. NPDC016309]|uniref:erythromycin esterase family protein n=1 Tax=Streptomyces sp. NPDC016309 TaxID=3364965 RepID=UPI0036F6C0B4
MAHPLRSTAPSGGTTDLRALGAMIGDARVVGLGEATHGSHEFFTMKERVFRYLVEEKGFTTFSLEMSWSAGLEIDDYLQGGGGSAHRIAEETLAGSPWERDEFVHLIDWMRDHNRRHPERTVHFMGDDIGAPRLGDRVFDRVTAQVARSRPASLPRLQELYAGLRPMDDIFAYLEKPTSERRQNAARAQEALDLVTAAVEASGGEAGEWAVQHARNIAQTFAFAGFDAGDPSSVAAAQRLRDRVMADTVLWWHRRTGDKILLSAHNGHIGYLSSYPELYPVPQGASLRDALGRHYVSIGFTFNRGSFLTGDAAGGEWKKTTVPPATRDMHEHTLDRVRHRDYYVDLRTAPPAARRWLDVARPTYDAGSLFEANPLPELAVGRAYDVLIHLHRVREARPLRSRATP